ncbi:MAG: hypothetical protein ACT4SY_03125 [Hyphomicrobiales bacterium]
MKTGPSETISGLADVEAPHVLPLFRRDGAPSPSVSIRRVKWNDDEFLWITEPAEGIVITAADVLIRRAEIERFEKRHGLFSSAQHSDCGVAEKPSRRGGPGVPPRYDWDAFYGALARRIHEQGVPATQAELVREMLSWFEEQDIDHAPDESTVKRKITVVWRELHRA